MKNIRHSVFETNSSSTHSISISSSSDGIYDTIVPEDGTITLNGGEFGWQWQRFNDSLTKANYAAEFAYKNEVMREMLTKVIKEHTGAKEVVFDLSEDTRSPNWSYIDHDSSHVGGEAFKSEEALKDWMFNSSSWLFLGNDNESVPPNFYDVDTNIKFKYELRVEGSDLVHKFQKKPNKNELIEALGPIIHRHHLCERSYNHYPNDGYEFFDYDVKVDGGDTLSSLSNIKENFVTLFKLKDKYSANSTLLKSVVIKFTLNKI